MKSLKTILLALSVAAIAAFGTGCGNACDEAADHIEECGGKVTGGDGECSDAAEAAAERRNDLSCEEIKEGSKLIACAAGGG